MTSTYKKLTLHQYHEILLAMLSVNYAFESFEETDTVQQGYIRQDQLSADIMEEINTLIESFEIGYEWQDVEDQNWNELWESNFQAVEIDNDCRIRAEFHPSLNGFIHEIVIQPKMAFGTGHHQTTWMMIKSMASIDFKNKTVFDYGCGTGILAIYAAMLGADVIEAVDIEHESYLNTIENAHRNGVSNIIAFEGDLSAVPSKQYDVILANINRNILLESVSELSARSKTGSLLLLSGILDVDVEMICNTYLPNGFDLKEEKHRETWCQLTLSKR